MKIRVGFVSNSSSSSFIIIGKPANATDIMQPDIYIWGDHLGDGYDFFKPNHDIRKVLQKYYLEHGNLPHDMELYSVKRKIQRGDTLEAGDVGYKAFDIEQDYHCNNTLDYFVDHYINDKD